MKKKIIIISSIVIVIIIAVGIVIYILNNSEKSVIKKFLKQYYTIDKMVATNEMNEEVINNEKKKYAKFLESECLDKFVGNRKIFRNITYAYENQCTLAIDRLEINFSDKVDKQTNYFKFKILVKANYNDNTTKTSFNTGHLYIKNINGKSRITYISFSELDFK